MPILLTRPRRLPSVKTLRARNLPVATCENVGITGTPMDPNNPEHVQSAKEFLEEWNKYLINFLPPVEECPRCTATLMGTLGSFQWGLVHGRGQCGICGYPFRAHHRLTNGSELSRVLLAYHPSALVTKKGR